MVDRLSNEGRDLGQFLGELLSHLRTVMLLPHAPEVALAEVGAEEREALREQASNVPTAEVVWLIESLGDTLGRIKRGGDPKLELELSFLKLTRDYTEPSVEVLVRRLEALELAVEQGDMPRTPGTTTDEAPEVESTPEKVESEALPAVEEEKEPHEVKADEVPELAAQWDVLMQDLRDERQAPAAAVYEEARVEAFDGAVLELAFPHELSIYVRLAQDARHADPLREAIARRFGVSPRIESRVADGADTRPLGEEASEQVVSASPPVDESGVPSGDETPAGTDEDRGGSGAEAQRGVSGAAEGDDTVRSENEAFQMAREWFGSRDPNGGN
jgi:DNA polymerase-3 subunit gamma/tau